MSWAGHVVRMEEGTSAFKILTGKPTGKRPIGREILTTNGRKQIPKADIKLQSKREKTKWTTLDMLEKSF